MGGRAIQRINKNDSNFLGDSDTKAYLEYYYDKTLQGEDEDKFKDFTKLFEDNESLQQILMEENIEFPSECNKMLSQNGFFDRLTEQAA